MNKTADVAMFMSADVVGSTAFKARSANDATAWLEAFATLFRELPLIFIGEMGMAFIEEDDMPEAGVWKVMGDEVIFVALPDSARDAALIAHAFTRTVSTYDRRLAERWPLRIRGTCWAAELGVRNRQIEIPEMFGGRDGQPYRDFLGPDVDTGFRLSAHAGHGEVIISPNLVEAIGRDWPEAPLRFRHFGDKSLKGVIGGQPFPLIMARASAADDALVSGETESSVLADRLAAMREQLLQEHAVALAPSLFDASDIPVGSAHESA